MLSTKEAAKYLGISPEYLRNMRHGLHKHEGPEYVVRERPQGIAYKYTIEALQTWSKQHTWSKDKGKKLTKKKRKRSLMGKHVFDEVGVGVKIEDHQLNSTKGEFKESDLWC